MAASSTVFRLGTAIVTPFDATGAVDYAALSRLGRHLVQTGTDAVIALGSTGESPTLTATERVQILETLSADLAGTDVPLIAGSGTNDTHSTIARAKEAVAAGADALLLVVPYYNKPSSAGLLAHFGAVAEAVDVPLILYNIPGRTGILMSPDTMAALHERYPHIVGVKQSHPDMDQVSDIRRLCPETFSIWSGDDSLTLPMMSLGACGVISVASHVVGRSMRTMIDAAAQGDFDAARAIHLRLMPLFRGLFTLPNPTNLKTLLAEQGWIQPGLRLPLVPPSPSERETLLPLLAWVDAS
jgi:4-hydroxy-tetrahydrodipicolinate synthase